MSHGINLTSMADWKPMVIDLGTSVDVYKNLTKPIERGDQIWLRGYYADTLSTPFIKIEISDSSGALCQEVVADTSLTGGSAIMLAEPGTATPVRREYNVPEPLLMPQHDTHRIVRLHFKVTSWTDAAVTYNKLVLFFGISQLGKSDPMAFPNKFPISQLANDAYSQHF